MPTADNSFSTPAGVPHSPPVMDQPSRRGLLAGIVALPALAAPLVATAALPPVESSCPAGSNPDAALIALCAEYRARGAAMNALTDPWMDIVGGWPDHIQAECDAYARQGHALQAAIAATPALTPAGFRAKATFILAQYSHYPDGSPDADNAIAWSLARDLLALNGGAA